MNHLYKDQEIPCEVLARRTASAGMEVIQDCFESPPPPCKHLVKLEEEPGDLLEKSWFFGNLLDRKTRMSRCFSDPCCPSSKLSEEEMAVGKSYEETFSSLKKLPQGERFASPGLMRTPSLPERSTHHAKGRNDIVDKGSKSRLQPSSSYNLFRAPSLPTSIGREEIQQDEEESDFSMSKLIRQASLKSSDMLPQKRLPKAVTLSSSTPRNRQRRKPDLESIKTESPDGKMVRSHPISGTKLDRIKSDLLDELKGFKNLSFKWDSQDDKKEENKSSSSHDHGWQGQTSSSSVDKRSAEDMKAQIKFWARTVASNVRPEC